MTDQIATAKDWATTTFEPLMDDSEFEFNMTNEMEKAQSRAIVKCFALKILRTSDVQLTEMVSSAENPNVMIDFFGNLEELEDYYKNGIECVKGAHTRLLVAMTRFAEQEGIDLDEGEHD